MNKVILMGRLTRDPETRYSQGGSEPLNITRYSLAVNRRFKKEGEPDADFINCVAFRKNGEFAARFFKKGMMVAVTGSLQIRNWDDPQTNQRKQFTEVIVDDQYFAESKASFEARGGSQGTSAPAQRPAPSYRENDGPPADIPPDFFIDQELSDDDLPF
ncbi:MAG: single-stranded DNA-binding protein [Defluviitaleaceae bacterium]|nr:single-stranded DNA-binding protein [Defluviitaleaceae bacterium]MCL2837334.1 single-stranded DNA-binding protein [Defluviitaleaceae bacterium]